MWRAQTLIPLAREGGSPLLLGQAGCSMKGYQRHGFVPEIHHGVVGDEGIHKTDHVVSAETLLLRGNLVGDDVQALVHLGKRRARPSPLCTDHCGIPHRQPVPATPPSPCWSLGQAGAQQGHVPRSGRAAGILPTPAPARAKPPLSGVCSCPQETNR